MTINSNGPEMNMGTPVYLNGNSANGYAVNEHTTNGYSINDTTNGHVNGHATNGHAANGHATINGHDVEPTTSGFSPIAICGMACRLPGGIASPEQLWDFLIEGGDARSRVPESRFNISAYHSTIKKPGAANTEFGYFLDESVDLAGLDTSFFSMPRNEVARLDPQQRLLLEVARESIDDAGEVDWKGSNIGVYVGSFGNDWYDAFNQDSLKYGIYQATATHDFMISERLSHEMDLRGPSMTIRTACSSALVGLNEASLAIARGDCDSAIVGGTSIIMAPALMTAMAEQGVLSPDGSCKTFSNAANGYARGEAIVSFYVKSLDAALRDGNPIRSVIAGTAANFDGKTPTLSMPNPVAQEALIRRAYKVAGISDFGKTGFFECHGTGTSAGDLVETSAVASVFGNDGVHIGSIKPNLGHSEGASGLTSLLKAVLALEHRTIPPNIKSLPLNSKIPFEKARLTVPHMPLAWPEDREERVSINSFGVGGANAHVIVESAGKYTSRVSDAEHLRDNEPQLLVYSANTAQSLDEMLKNYHEFLGKTPKDFADIAYTLANKREHLGHRSFAVVTKDTFDPASPLSSYKGGPSSVSPSLVMVFTGQGAAWPRFGRELLRTNSIFSQTIKSLDKYLQTLAEPPSWNLAEELSKPAKTSRVYEAEFSQPLCTAVQVALVDTLAAVGVKPSAVVGHSSGEIAAAYAAGGLTAAEAIAIAFHRGATTKVQLQPGGMGAVGLGWDEVREFLVPGVVTACDNSPRSVTLSGDADKLGEVLASVKQAHPDVSTTMLKVEKAYHSHHMKALGDDYQQAMTSSGVVGTTPKIPFFSSVTGKLFGLKEDDTFGPQYWRANLENPVLFRSAVSGILQNPDIKNQCLFELGPHSALAGPLRQIITHNAKKVPYIASLVRNQNSVENLLQALGKLYTLHVDIDFKALMAGGNAVSDLPRYPWDHQRRHWFESRVSTEWRHRKYPAHDLLGIKVPESTELDPVWRNLLHVENVPWLCDHKINEGIVMPFAAYVGMAGEAVRQVSGIEDGISLRHVVVNAALLVNQDAPTELVTSLQRHKLTDSLNSEWWAFSISSHNGHVWTKHCTGEVRAESLQTPPRKDQGSILPRKVDIDRWNAELQRNGLNYGPHFNTLSDVRCSTGDAHSATGHMENNRWGDESKYHLHPVILDSYFQLLSIAHSNGVAHSYRRLIAASVENMTMYRCADENLNLAATAVFTEDGLIGHGHCGANSGTILNASGVRVSFFEEAGGEDEPGLPITARNEWVPHVDFKNAAELINEPIGLQSSLPQLAELAQLAIALSQILTKSIDAQTPYLAKYKEWLSNVPTSQINIATLSQGLDGLVKHLKDTPAANAAETIVMVFSNIEALFKGEKTGFEVLNDNGNLDAFKSFLKDYDNSNLLQSLSHSKPNLRVLEIGAGVGEKTTEHLKSLTRPNGQVLYSQYVFSDASSALVTTAKERLKGASNMEFTTLDVSQDLADQGFEDRKFDLIIAAGVLNETANLQESLKNVRGLLAPEGRLLLQEPRAGSPWAKFVLGIMPSWWSHEQDGRSEEPFVDVQRWQGELKTAGFEDVETVSDALASTVIVAKPLAQRAPSKKITLLQESGGSVPIPVVRELESQGYEIHRCSLTEIPPADQDVLALLDEAGPFFENIESAGFAKFKAFVSNLKNSGLLWVTRPCNVGCQDPRYAPVVGLARTLRSEMGIDFAVCETKDLSSAGVSHALLNVLQKFQARDQDASMGPDYEYIISNDEILVNRIFPISLDAERVVSDSSDEAVVTITKQGLMDTLRWAATSSKEPKDDEVEVEVHATGLNFRDVLLAMGIIERSNPTFGYEAAGIVRRVGKNVTKLRVGDRAVLMGMETFSTVVTAPEMLYEKLPDTMSFADGASMPLVFTTAIYSLLDIGRLSTGQSILIHSGCGGVGLAAIQIAQMIGAEIFTTVSSEEKIRYLMNTHGIPRSRIFNSRSNSFVEDVLRETNGKGVDLALNSLSGEQLHATWSCIAKWGTMVEIGKRDLLGAAKLDMAPFLANRNYCCVDLDQMSRERPQMVGKLLHYMMKCYQQGHIKPVRVERVVSAGAIQDAFRFMQQGKHIGKIILQLRDESGNLELGDIDTSKKADAQLDGEGSYLLVGGLGGLGRAMSVWMVDHGARNLTFLSRSAGKAQSDHDFVHEIESMGCTVQLVRGDVTNADDVARAVEGTLAPLKGIIQMSMVLRDQMFDGMSLEDWHAVNRPKVQGTWNLHEATRSRNIELDTFVLFSSLSGIVGQTGQANYAAANTFLDSFSQYRANMGLACTAIDLGAMDGVGYLSKNQDLLRKMQGTGWRVVQEAELLEGLEAAMMSKPNGIESKQAESRSGFLLGISPTVPLSSPDSNARLRRDARMAVYHNVGSQSNKAASGNDGLREFLKSTKSNPNILTSAESVEFLATEIGKKLFSLLLKSEDDGIDIKMNTADLGLDSLVAVELRSWWKLNLGFDITVLEMLSMGTLEALGKFAGEKLMVLHG